MERFRYTDCRRTFTLPKMIATSKPLDHGTEVTAESIPELAVVELEHERDGRVELELGVVLAADSDGDCYIVELVDRRGSKRLVTTSARDLRVRHLV
jgi:hypothetical protein